MTSDDCTAWPAPEALRVEIDGGETFYLRWDGYSPDVYLYEAGTAGSLVDRGPNALSVLLEALCEHDAEATLAPIAVEEVPV